MALTATIVGGETAGTLAERWRLDRSTVAAILQQARASFRRELTRVAGPEQALEVVRFAKRKPAALVAAFQAVDATPASSTE
jgi:hypothetical protein